MKRLAILIALLVLSLGAGTAYAAGVSTTVHNLSLSGPGPVKSTTEDEVCVFCHTPHNANPSVPLWNHTAGSGTYQIYSSESLSAIVASPNGTSKLCLTCHDGTVALGSLVHGTAATMTNGIVTSTTLTVSSANNLGTNLADDHPFSFVPVTGAQIQTPPAGDPVKLDGQGRVQCRSCHNPHDNTYGNFLVKANDDAVNGGGRLCLTCHRKEGWTTDLTNVLPHRDSTNLWNGTPMKTKGCSACHEMHGASEPKRLYRDNAVGATKEEDACFACHNGTTAPDIRNEFLTTLASRHPVQNYSGLHFPRESYKSGDPKKPARHNECVDCHNPHTLRRYSSAPPRPQLFGELIGIPGVEPTWSATNWTAPTGFTVVASPTAEYQICFNCHSTYSYGATPPTALSESTRAQTDIAMQFSSSNASYHIVKSGVTGKITLAYPGGFVTGWGASTVLYCDDCHAKQGSTFRGPHGSGQKFILVRPWTINTGTTGTYNDLCFKCHDYKFYTGNSDGPATQVPAGTKSKFSNSGTINLHVNKHNGDRCRMCHSFIPHGWQRQGLLVTTADPHPYDNGDGYTTGSNLIVNTWGSGGTWNQNNCSHSVPCG